MNATLTFPKQNVFARDVLLVVLSSLLISLMGQFSIHLPFTPIPISLRCQTILLLSVLLGSRRAGLAVLGFLMQGAIGLPVFAGGASTLAALLSPKGGYIIGFLMAAIVVGYMSEKKVRHSLSFLAGTLIIYACGSAYLSTFVGFSKALLLGVVPFVIGDFLKTAVCLKILGRFKHA